MFKFLVLIFFSFVSINSGSEVNTTTPLRIINGGLASEPTEYSVHITSKVTDLLVNYGGGTLISTTVVLTQTQVILGYPELYIRFGTTDVGYSYYVEATHSVRHPDYDTLTHELHDVALLRLAKSVDVVAPGVMRPAQIYYGPVAKSINSNETAKSGLIVGFGMIYTEPWTFDYSLMYMHQTVIPKDECRTLLGSRPSLLQDSHFCAMDRERNASACLYDTGAGFVVNENGINYILGVLSVVSHMCRPQYPNLYTRVSDYKEWIEMYLELWAE